MLIVSISGIRGTIGGVAGENLTPIDVVNFAAAYGRFLRENNEGKELLVAIGRDARTSGPLFSSLVSETLRSIGINIIDCGLVPTPTLEMAIVRHGAHGGVMITASHNPSEYNGLKLLNSEGEFLSGEDGATILEYTKSAQTSFAPYDALGSYSFDEDALRDHVNAILDLSLIDTEAIIQKKFTIAVDGINSVGGIAVPYLLERLGALYLPLFCEPSGLFAHTPEPLSEHLGALKQLVKETGADVGIAVDPDVDRLVLVDETGEMFGEEYTLVACADYILSHQKGAVVNNLSSSRALRDLAEQYDVPFHSSAVGEKNVVTVMKSVNSVIGGEGSGGIIYPELHHGRDALVGIALVLALLTERGVTLSELRKSYTSYVMAKEKISLAQGTNTKDLLDRLAEHYKAFEHSQIDGLKVDFPDAWVHIRSSNTEPILRIYTEAKTQEEAQKIAEENIALIKSFME